MGLLLYKHDTGFQINLRLYTTVFIILKEEVDKNKLTYTVKNFMLYAWTSGNVFLILMRKHA